jgi:hypothetical protein
MKKILIAITGALLTTMINALDSEDYDIMGKQALSAFTCSHLASLSYDSLNNSQQESKRLFDYGYKTGDMFINASKQGKIKKYKHAPVIFTFLINERKVNNSAFILGRLYEWSYEKIDKEFPVMNVGRNKYKVMDKYHNKNCELIGR